MSVAEIIGFVWNLFLAAQVFRRRSLTNPPSRFQYCIKTPSENQLMERKQIKKKIYHPLFNIIEMRGGDGGEIVLNNQPATVCKKGFPYLFCPWKTICLCHWAVCYRR